MAKKVCRAVAIRDKGHIVCPKIGHGASEDWLRWSFPWGQLVRDSLSVAQCERAGPKQLGPRSCSRAGSS